MADLIDEVINYLVARGIATQQGVDIFRGYIPDGATGTVMAVIDTGGTAPDVDLPVENPTFQVYIKADTYDAGLNLKNAVKSALHQYRGRVLGTGTVFFHFIYAISNGGHVGRDERGQDVFSINFQAKTH